jgi:hypothetical protein
MEGALGQALTGKPGFDGQTGGSNSSEVRSMTMYWPEF